MRFEIVMNQMTREVQFFGSFSSTELARLNLSDFDRRVIEGSECSPADSLLALELIYRRAAEQSETGKAGAK